MTMRQELIENAVRNQYPIAKKYLNEGRNRGGWNCWRFGRLVLPIHWCRCCGSAFKTKAVQTLLDYVIELLPSALNKGSDANPAVCWFDFSKWWPTSTENFRSSAYIAEVYEQVIRCWIQQPAKRREYQEYSKCMPANEKALISLMQVI